MGWKRLFVFLTVVLVLVGGGKVMQAVHGVGSSGTSGSISTGSLSAGSLSAGGLSAGSISAAAQAVAGPGSSSTAGLIKSTTFNPAVPHDAPIPKDSLRLRIIANSDSAKDQQVKREVRDAIVVTVAKLVGNAKTEQQAQEIVAKHLPALQSLAQQVVRSHGFSYDVKATVGLVPFPTKVYGNRVYPAGNYKALRLILGKGQGHNWWCVLFPPLCFVDIADGDAVPNTGGFPDLPPLETITVKNLQGQPTQVQVRLASLDYGEELWKTIRGWFAH